MNDNPVIHVKSKVKEATEGQQKASIRFIKGNTYEVSAKVDGLHVFGSPFRVQVEESEMPRRCKLTLIGCNLDSLMSVGDALQGGGGASLQEIGFQVELWGIPKFNTNQTTYEAATLASITDGGVFVYVWDRLDSNLPGENLSFWLQNLSIKAPNAEVVLLGLNLSTSLAKQLDLKPFQAINPNLKRAVLVGSSYQKEPNTLVKEIKSIVEEKVQFRQEVVWFRVENLATKIKEERDAGSEILSERGLIYIARECGIHGECQFAEAARYLEETGLGLITGQEEVFLILKEVWLTRNLLEIARSCYHGILGTNNLGNCLCNIRICIVYSYLLDRVA